jgi:hypothetical protein
VPKGQVREIHDAGHDGSSRRVSFIPSLFSSSSANLSNLRAAISKTEQDLHDIESRILLDEKRANDMVVIAPPDQNSEVPEALLATQSNGFTSTLSLSPKPTHPPVHRNTRSRRNLNPPPPSTSTYYYYQAASGAAIFLNPLDIRILFAHYNSYAAFPDSIAVRVESCSEGTVNDDLRKRCKYLAHLPEAADVVFVEADLADVVGQEGLKGFEGALRMRRARRKEKGKKDDRAKARAEERERERLPALGRQ